MSILILQEPELALDSSTFYIESKFNARVYGFLSLEHARHELYSKNLTFDLAIVDIALSSSKQVQELLALAQSSPLLIASERNLQKLVTQAAINEAHITWSTRSKLLDSIKPFIKSEDEILGDQIKIRAQLLLAVGPLQGDVYLKLSEKKFVKVFRKGDPFDEADLKRFAQDKGVHYLYIKKAQAKEFAEKYHQLLEQELLLSEAKPEVFLKKQDTLFETIQEIHNQIGFRKEVQDLVKTQVKLVLKTMSQSPTLDRIIQQLHNSNVQYISSHSNLISYLSCAIASHMHWASEVTYQKLILSAFLHDFTLTDEALAKGDCLEDVSKFSTERVQKFKDHPQEAAELAKKMLEIPPDVDTIIRQHHEKPDGSGFPRGITHTYISPLSTVFIVAHDLARKILNSNPSVLFDIKSFIQEAQDRYQGSQFKKVIKCLESLEQVK